MASLIRRDPLLADEEIAQLNEIADLRGKAVTTRGARELIDTELTASAEL